MGDGADGEGLHAFVGRERELETLLSALDGAARGTGVVHLVRGEAGIGKSRTAREVAAVARARGFRVGIGHCSDGDAAPAYEPWVRALEDTAAGRELAARRTSLEASPSGEDDDVDLRNEREQLFRRVETALREAAADGPQLLVLEDLHWADLDSLGLLRHLARRLHDCAWMALCTLRDGEPREERRGAALAKVEREASALPLGPFDETEVAALVAHWSGERPAPELVEAARSRSGGNPLFLCELLALVIAVEGNASVAALGAVGIPPVLRQLLERRLEPLGEETTELLVRGALLGDPFELTELASWAGKSADVVLAALESAEALRFVEPAGTVADRFRFSHALLRDALLARVSRAERAGLHRDLAALLESAGRNQTEPELARLVEHHRHGLSSHSATRAVECATAAAALAARERAPEQAVRHVLLALDSLPATELAADARGARRCELLLALGEARSQTGERDLAREAYLEAAQIGRQRGLADSLALAVIGMVGRDEDPRGLNDETVRWLDLAIESIGPGDTPVRAGLLALGSRVARKRADPARGEDLAREAVAIAERVQRPATRASAVNALHYAIRGPDALEERLALSERMVEAARQGSSRRTELRARQRRYTDLLQVGNTIAADEELARIEGLARDRDHPTFHWNALSLAAGRDLWRGRLESAERRMAESLEQGRRAGLRNAGALYTVQMFHLREAQGRLGELRPAMQAMVESNPQVRSLPLIIPLAAMQEGDEVLTRASFEPLAAHDFEDVPQDDDWLAVMTSHARVASHLRDHARCDVLLQKLRPYAHWCVALPDGQHWEGSVAGRVALLEWVLGKSEEARGHFLAALDTHRRAGALPVLAHTLEDFGVFESEQGNEAEAREKLEEALALRRRVGVPLFIERAEASLAALGTTDAVDFARDGGQRRTGRFQREGVHWTIEFAGRRAVVEHRKGLLDLATLLASPGREMHVLDLMASPAADTPAPTGDEAKRGAGPAALQGLDAAAVGGYRERLAELRAELDEAVARSDLGAQRAAEEEIRWLEEELGRAFGAGRSVASEFSQKARKAVYNRIRNAIAAVAEVHPELGQHLRHSIRTGVVCVYRPEADEEWLVDAAAS